MELVDVGGQVYLPNTNSLGNMDYAMLLMNIPSRAVIPISVGYLVPTDLQSRWLMISDARGSSVAFNFSLETEVQPAPQFDGIDVRLVSVTTIDRQITTRLRIYNGQSTPINFTQDDI